MTLTFFGYNLRTSSKAGKLALFGILPAMAVLTGYAIYLCTVAIGAVLGIHPVFVFVLLLALTTKFTFQNGKTVGLLPGRYTRDAFFWACFALSLYHYAKQGMMLEVSVLSAILVGGVVGRVIGIVQARRAKMRQPGAALHRALEDIGYSDPGMRQ